MTKVRQIVRRSFLDILPIPNTIHGRVWFVLACAGLLCGTPNRAPAITNTWIGLGSSGNWSDGNNWGAATPPVNGDTVLFPVGVARPVNTNNLASGLVLNQMQFRGSNYVIYGNAFTLTNSIIATNVSGLNTINNNITFTNSNITIFVSNSASLTLAGSLGGSSAVTKNGLGILTYSGSTANTYTNLTTVNEGELDLAKSSGLAIAAGAGLMVGDGVGTDTVRYLGSEQIWSLSTPVTITNSGVLDLNGYHDGAGPLALNGGQILGGTGFFAMVNTVLIGADSSVYGNVRLDTSNVVFTNTAPSTLYMYASVYGYSSTYGFTKAGYGSLYLSASNSYGGLTVVQQGWLYAENAWALGTTNNGTVVSNGASLVLTGSVGITNEALTLNGAGAGTAWGALDSESSGTNTWAGPVTLNADSTIDTWVSTCVLRIIGPINGAGGLNQFGSWFGGGTLYLEGASANTYAGTTTVTNSTLVLNKSVSNGAIPGNVVIYGTMRLGANQQIADTADVLVNSGGLFDLGTYYEYIDTLRGLGTVNFGSGGWIRLGVNNGTSTFDGSFTGIGYAPGYTVGKTGSGTFTMNGTNTFSAGVTHVYNGKLVINGYQPQSPVIVDNGATLGGSGTVGTIAAAGNISPGTSPGILTSSNVTFTSSGSFTVDLKGPTPGTSYDQLNVRGTNTLANATLVVNPAFTASVNIGDQFTILNNDGADAITGTFNGLANGAQFSAGGYTFRINYNGGSGNDVVLALWGVPGATVTLNAVDSGWYDNRGYHDPINQNYLAGELGYSTNLYRDWFVFNVPVFTNSIIHAELIINCYDNVSPDGQETYVLRQVTNSIPTLEAGGSGLTNIYNDLGDGGIYGIRNVYVAESYEKAIIPLNVTFMNDATAASGSQMALGGSVVSLYPTNNTQCLFGLSSGFTGDVQLRLTFGTNLVINSADRGWYDSFGDHAASSKNYCVGDDGTYLYRNFFVFNLPVLSSQLVDAQLLVNSYTNVSPSGVETYQLYDVTNSIAVLTNYAFGATNVYADLGSGAVYGGRNVYVSESGLIASIPLNGRFVAAAQTNSGGRIALGGALTSLNPTPTTEYLFGYSSGLPADAQLWLGFLTAPASHPSFVGGTPTYLGNSQFQFAVSGTTGTTNEIQGSFDFQNWDFIGDLVMTNSTTSFLYTNNTVVPYRFFRAEQLQ